jgi:DNA-binding GntR family transcriptional regulator
VNSEHKAIADATLARDVPRAAALLTAHLERTSQILLHTAISQRASSNGSGEPASAGTPTASDVTA